MTITAAQARQLAVANAVARCSLGVVAVAFPAVPLAPWLGPARRDRGARLLARALGARDLAIGLGTLLACQQGTPVRGWVEAGGLADAGDVLVTLGDFKRLPRLGRWLVLAAAGSGVVAARVAAVAVDDRPESRSRFPGNP